MYFQRTWVELYQLSLKNFLNLALSSSACPQVVQQLSLMVRHIQHLDLENKVLRQKVRKILWKKPFTFHSAKSCFEMWK